MSLRKTEETWNRPAVPSFLCSLHLLRAHDQLAQCQRREFIEGANQRSTMCSGGKLMFTTIPAVLHQSKLSQVLCVLVINTTLQLIGSPSCAGTHLAGTQIALLSGQLRWLTMTAPPVCNTKLRNAL